MKAVLLHGTDGTSESNWLPWVAGALRADGWDVWAPDLPRADEPDSDRYLGYLREHAPWSPGRDTAVVGHSSGALAALTLLRDVSPETPVGLSVLVGAFKDDLGWPSLAGLFRQPYDFKDLSRRAERFVLVHSDTDPFCPLSHAEFLAEQLGGELVVHPGQGHFSATTEPPYRDFPWLLDLLRSFEDERRVG